MTVHDIPALNAALNALATSLLLTGFVLIKRGKREAHRACMLTALGVSAVFLASYVTHKILVHGVHTPFGGQRWIHSVYYVMLLSHVVLAMAIVPLALRTAWLALTRRFETHRAWARWTFPIWLYVSVTGVLVYLFLYQWWPAGS